MGIGGGAEGSYSKGEVLLKALRVKVLLWALGGEDPGTGVISSRPANWAHWLFSGGALRGGGTPGRLDATEARTRAAIQHATS